MRTRSMIAALRRWAGAFSAAGVVALCACEGNGGARRTERPESSPPEAMVELLPGVRADVGRGVVEFDGEIAIDCHDPETPDVYLEVICCRRDTREHEALVVTDVAPSAVHAALLAAGAEPGAPGGWREEGGKVRPILARGDPVGVTIVVTAGAQSVEHDPATWITRAGADRTLAEAVPQAGWVFAGSRMRERGGREVYDADGTGQLIGLHTFGSETVAWTRVESPDSWIDEPQWLANAKAVPPIGTPVTVRLRVARPRSP